jgi:hypothetical protein
MKLVPFAASIAAPPWRSAKCAALRDVPVLQKPARGAAHGLGVFTELLGDIADKTERMAEKSRRHPHPNRDRETGFANGKCSAKGS